MKLHTCRISCSAAGWLLGIALLVLAFPVAGAPQHGAGVSEVDLKYLIIGDKIPGFRETAAVVGGTGPFVELDLEGKDGTFASRIKCYWESNDGVTDALIDIRLTVYETPQAAMNAARFYGTTGATPHVEIPADKRVGEATWTTVPVPNNGCRIFALGRVFAIVGITSYSPRKPADGTGGIKLIGAKHEEIADTIARGVEWAIRQRPELLSKTDTTPHLEIQADGKPTSPVNALTYHGVTWAPLSALELAGAKVNWEKKSNLAIVTYQGKKLEIRPFHREANLSGRKVDLGASVLITADGPVVPLRKVAEALGIKLEFTATTVHLG